MHPTYFFPLSLLSLPLVKDIKRVKKKNLKFASLSFIVFSSVEWILQFFMLPFSILVYFVWVIMHDHTSIGFLNLSIVLFMIIKS
jgi:hypothetical protein